MSKKSPKKFPETITRLEVETFRDIRPFHLDQLIASAPSCFNGRVQVRRWRVTAELIEEPIEIIRQRIRQLWWECDNHHHATPLMQAAESYGFKLNPAEFGKIVRQGV